MLAKRSNVLGGSDLLAGLTEDLRAAKGTLLIIGPWLDSFFADLICSASAAELRIRIVTRPRDTAGEGGWEGNRACIDALTSRFAHVEARLLPKLHAKALLIDDQLAYLGSANWYRHSLEQARELAVRTSVEALAGCAEELEAIWGAAGSSAVAKETRPVPPKAASVKPRPQRVEAGMDREAIDPLARHVLETVPKAFVLGKRKGRS